MNNALQQIPFAEADSLNQTQRLKLAQAVEGLTRQQLNWASGYLAGLSHAQGSHAAATHSAQQITILYASQTGNAKSVAQQLAESFQASGIQAKLVSSADYRPRSLGKEQYLLLVISTQGEGEAPESAFELQQYLFAESAPELKQLNYAVFGLGDSSYADFCQAGRDFDQRLYELGAKRLIERVDADLDFEQSARDWQQTVIEQSRQWLPASTDNVVSLNPLHHAIRYDRNNPFEAQVLSNRRITTEQALSDVHHIELQIDSSSLHYQPGDSLGVWSRNNPELIDEILQLLKLDPAASVSVKQQQLTLTQALQEKLEITQLHPALIKAWSALAQSSELESLVNDASKLREYAASHQFIDLLQQYPASLDAQTLAQTLLPLQPRLYSIASSQQVFEDEVHLTVSTLQYQNAEGQTRYGSASQYLNQRIQTEDVLGVYVAESSSFRLPQKPDTPIIMIAAGTGIAPFRAFMQQRDAEQASGENWLVFGNRNFHEDFLYQVEWQKYRNAGLLNRVSLAFSRDDNDRAYVQDRLFEEAEELNRWLNQGAYLYVCGSSALDSGVQQALIDMVQQQQSLSTEQAEQHINNLRAEGRYLKDIY